MADLPETICFKASVLMRERIQHIAEEEHRTVGQMVRLLVERKLAELERPEKEDNDV
jgi:hypothetical protein